ncbi:MAG: caspase family protein [Pseudomonadota bacterium]
MFKRILAALAVSLAAIAPEAQAAIDKKVALVVGNAAYQNAPALANPVTDAKAMTAAFERLGFEVVSGYDLDLTGMNKLVRQFRLKARDADLTTFFYAGHALQAEGQNYLVPIDALFQDDAALDFEAVKVDFVMRQMRNPDGVSLVFLDGCRDNPLARSLGARTRSTVGRGLAPMDISDAGRGLAIAFATAPGEVAYDGKGVNSPFTTALLSHIETEGADITEVMSRVTGDVLDSTDERQRPWLNVSLTGPVVLKPKTQLELIPAPANGTGVEVASLQPGASDIAPEGYAAPAAPASSSNYDVDAETALFTLAEKNNSIAYYEAYIAKFPRGLFAEIAKAKILELRDGGNKVAAVSPAVPSSDNAPRAATDPAAAAPPTFFLTDEMRAIEGTQETEQALAMDRNKRREVQSRLNLVEGVNVGGADGKFGPRTRAGIADWQDTRGLIASGFLTEPQLKALETETEEQYAALLVQQRAAANKRRASTRSYQGQRSTKKRSTKKRRTSSKRRVTKRRTTRRRTVRRQRSNAANVAGAAFFGAVAGGIIGGAISR